MHFDVADIRVHADHVIGEIVVYRPSGVRIAMGLLEERLADARDHAALHLAASGLRVDDAAYVHVRVRARHPHDGHAFVEGNLDGYNGRARKILRQKESGQTVQ